MSRYLIERITALPNVTLHARKEVVALEGEANEGLRAARFRYTGEEITAPLRHLFLFIGADPNTGWLDGCGVALDDKGFVRTEAADSGPKGGIWAGVERKPFHLETSVPGVFAIGDARRLDEARRVGRRRGRGRGGLDPRPVGWIGQATFCSGCVDP